MSDSESTIKAFTRKPLSVRVRFEVFKRDDFTCRYCGCQSPAVVLEVDHIVPVSEGGSNDEINLITSCWECNHGKADVPLSTVITGEDPHDRAIMLIERERQLREYNIVLTDIRVRREQDADMLIDFWCSERDIDTYFKRDRQWIINQLEHIPPEVIRQAMATAIGYGYVADMRYVCGIVRNWRQQRGL